MRFMGCRTAHAGSIARPSRRDSIQTLVLLAVAHDELRARFAYQLAASGFTVVTDLAASLDASRPDVVVAELDAARSGVTSSVANICRDARLRGVPVIAVADDVSAATQTAARQGGCAAVCLTMCSAAALASGIHAVLDGREG
jgi:DNA-binding NarL/FixJ family response regulator